MIKKTLYLSPEASAMWDTLNENSQLSQSQFFEQLVRETFAQRSGEVGANCQKKNDNVSEQLAETLNKLKVIENDTNKKVFILLEMINSLITSSLTSLPEGYTSIEQRPHSWYSKSEATLKQKIYKKQYNKLAKEG